MGTTNDEETGERFFLALDCGRIIDEKLLFEATPTRMQLVHIHLP